MFECSTERPPSKCLEEPAVDISKSSTAHWQHCNEVTRNEHCQCSQDNRCKYSETYSEGVASTEN